MVSGHRSRPVDTAHDAHDWALVLAGGQGLRLRSLTTTSAGYAVPKQYCSLSGGSSLLGNALQRAATIAPAERTCVVVAAGHRRWWRPLSQLIPKKNIIVEPRSRGTAFAILLPLLTILQRDPQATLLVLPSDHFVRDEGVLATAMRKAMTDARSRGGSIVLLGFAPEEADPELGYIVPGNAIGANTREVVQVVEKPDATWAAGAPRRGALWNAFIFAAHGERLLELFKVLMPDVVMDVSAVCPQSDAHVPCEAGLDKLYEQLPTIDFLRGVIERCPARLRVAQVPTCGWSDLGTPSRVARVLQRERQKTTRASAPADLAGILNLATQNSQCRTGRDGVR